MTSNAGFQNIVTLRIVDPDTSIGEFEAAWTSGNPQGPAIDFVSWEVLHRTLSPKRLALVQALCGGEPTSIRELSRQIGRDFKGVHTDVAALIDAGIIEKVGNRISFPYDGIHVEFDIGVAA